MRTQSFFALVALAMLPGCVTPLPSGTEVTRFHVEQPIARETVAIRAANPEAQGSLEYRRYEAILAEALTGAGFTVVDAPDAAIVASFDVSRDTRYEPGRSSPVSIGIGGGSFGRRTGIGIGTSFGLGGSPGGEIDFARLAVRLARTETDEPIWEGSAERAFDPADETPAAVVQRLADALFQDFPGESGQTITVE